MKERNAKITYEENPFGANVKLGERVRLDNLIFPKEDVKPEREYHKLDIDDVL